MIPAAGPLPLSDRLVTKAGAFRGEAGESSCFPWPRAAVSVTLVVGDGSACSISLLSTMSDILGETWSMIVEDESFFSFLVLLDRLGNVDALLVVGRGGW